MFIVKVMSIKENFRGIVSYFLITGHLIRIFVPLERNLEDFVCKVMLCTSAGECNHVTLLVVYYNIE